MTVFWWSYVIKIILLKNSSKYISKIIKGLVFRTASLLILDIIYELVEHYLYMLSLFWIISVFKMIILILVLYFSFYVNLVFDVANFLVRNAGPQLKHYLYNEKKTKINFIMWFLRLFHWITFGSGEMDHSPFQFNHSPYSSLFHFTCCLLIFFFSAYSFLKRIFFRN